MSMAVGLENDIKHTSKLESIKNIVVTNTLFQVINDDQFIPQNFGVKKGVSGNLIVIQVTKSAIRFYRSFPDLREPEAITIEIDNDLCNDLLSLLNYQINVIAVHGIEERLKAMPKYAKIKLFQEKLQKMHHDNEWFPF